MSLIVIILKLIGTLFLGVIGLVCLLATFILRIGQADIRKNGKPTMGTVIDSSIIRNKDCNSMPGYHYRIVYTFQEDDKTYESVYKPNWRYRSRRASQKIISNWPAGRMINIIYDPEDPELTLCELNSWKNLLFPSLLFIIATTGIYLIWA